MNLKRVCMTSLVVFVAFFAMEFAVHSLLLGAAYKETASVWRPEADMKRLFPLMLLAQLLFAKFFAIVFAKGYETGKPGIAQGLRFGLLAGLLLGPSGALLWYVILPIPSSIVIGWLVTGLVEMVVLGLVAGAVYRP